MACLARIIGALVLGALWASTAAHARVEVTVVEYHHAGFDHYFVTPHPGEIALLDAHVPPFEQWSRTGLAFQAFAGTAEAPGTVAICRFFNDSFAPKSSHFYAARGLGCEATLERFTDWKLEDDQLFAVELPAADGSCASGTVPVYRLYNDGQGGAPNHRFVTSLATRQEMLARGYVAEGAGAGVAMCVPADRAPAVGLWRGTNDRGQNVTVLLQDDGSCYILYSRAGDDDVAGVVLGSGGFAGDIYTSTGTADVPFLRGGYFLAGNGALQATAVTRSSLRMTYGPTSITASYDAAYDTPVTLQDIAGMYAGIDGHRMDPHAATATIGADGVIAIKGQEFDFIGVVTPHGSTGVFDVRLSGAVLNDAPGVLFFDRLRQQLYMVVPFVYDGQDALFLIASRA